MLNFYFVFKQCFLCRFTFIFVRIKIKKKKTQTHTNGNHKQMVFPLLSPLTFYCNLNNFPWFCTIYINHLSKTVFVQKKGNLIHCATLCAHMQIFTKKKYTHTIEDGRKNNCVYERRFSLHLKIDLNVLFTLSSHFEHTFYVLVCNLSKN